MRKQCALQFVKQLPGQGQGQGLAIARKDRANSRLLWASQRPHDPAFVEQHTLGFRALAQQVKAYSPAWAEGITGIAAPRIVELARLAVLAGRIRLAIAVDSRTGIDRLADALKVAGTQADVFVEIDVGDGRCGIAATVAGVPCPLVTGAGTGTFALEAASGVWGELQCGSYVFMDRDCADNRPTQQPTGIDHTAFEHAFFVKSQVISANAAHAVIDAGHKAHATDSGMPRVWNGAFNFRSGGDEHGILTPVMQADGRPTSLPEIGDTVWLIPGHCEPTVNLHDRFIGVRPGPAHDVVESIWAVDARGCLP